MKQREHVGAKDVTAVEIMPSIENIEHHDYRPVVDVTLRCEDGTRINQQAFGDYAYCGRRDRAEQAAERAAIRAAVVAGRRGIPVIMGSCVDDPTPANTAKVIGFFALLFVVGCVAYGMAQLP